METQGKDNGQFLTKWGVEGTDVHITLGQFSMRDSINIGVQIKKKKKKKKIKMGRLLKRRICQSLQSEAWMGYDIVCIAKECINRIPLTTPILQKLYTYRPTLSQKPVSTWVYELAVRRMFKAGLSDGTLPVVTSWFRVFVAVVSNWLLVVYSSHLLTEGLIPL
jgi:RNase P protein component